MGILNILKKFGKILSSHQKLRIFQLTILMIIGGFLEVCSVSLILPFMNIVMSPEETMDKWYARFICSIFNIESSRAFLIFMAVGLACIYIVKNIYLMLEYSIQYRFVYRNMFELQKKLLASFLSRPYESFLSINSGEVIRIIGTDTSNAFGLLITLLSLFTELVVSIMLFVAIFLINPVVTACIAVILLMLMFVVFRVVKPSLRKAGINQQKSAAGMNKWLLQAIQGIKELKVMQKEDYFQENYDKNGRVYVNSLRWNQILGVAPRFLIEGICMGVMFIVLALLIYGGTDLEALIPMLSAVAAAAVRILPSMNRISGAMNSVAYGEPMIDKVIENLNLMEETVVTDYDQQVGFENFHLLKNEIRFSDITYHYPNSDEEILSSANMVIHKGESIGIVGASGAGKTTAVDIILGLLLPTKGNVLIDGIDIHSDMGAWLGQIGYIPQMIFMLDDTIRANVAFGENNVDDELVWKALKEASLDEFVKNLPDGLDTQIGERGTRLSGGQRQRIGIARALYKEPEILIFDEATSALDNETEETIIGSINGMHGKKTMIIIAHRITTIESCDHIFRVEKAKIDKAK